MAAKSKKGKVVAFNSQKGNTGSGKKSGLMMIGSIFILVIIVVAFVVAPALSGSSGYRGAPEFGRYGNIRIKFVSGNHFSQEVESANEMYSSHFKVDDMNESQINWMRRTVWRYAFDKSIIHYAMIYFMENSGFFITDKKIDRTIVKYFTQDGTFNSEAYGAMAASEKQKLRKNLREELTVQSFSNDVYYSQFNSEKQTDFLKNLSDTERNFNVVTFNFQDYPEKEVISYGKEHMNLFQRMRLSRVTVAEESEANDLLEKYNNNEYSFADLARNFSKDAYAENGGDVGWLYYNNLENLLSSEDLAALFASSKDEVTQAFKTDYGWTFFYIEEPAEDINLDEATGIEQVRVYMEKEEMGLIEDYLEKRAEDFLVKAKETGFSEAAAKIGKTISTTGYFPVNYGNLSFIKGSLSNSNDILTMAGAGSSKEFYAETFSLSHKGDITDPVILDKTIAVLQFDSEREIMDKAQDYEIRNFFIQTKQGYFEKMVKDSKLLVDEFDETYAEISRNS